MDNYKSNSDKARQEQKEEKKIESVVTNAAKTRKKGDIRKLADIFISDDVNDEMFDYLTKLMIF